MKRTNAFARMLLTTLCSLALAWICMNVAPVTAEAASSDNPNRVTKSIEITVDASQMSSGIDMPDYIDYEILDASGDVISDGTLAEEDGWEDIATGAEGCSVRITHIEPPGEYDPDDPDKNYKSVVYYDKETDRYIVYITGPGDPAPVVPDDSEDEDDISEAETWQPGRPCHHNYVWETYKAATATTDGIMRYRCKYCGTVEYEVPTAAYYVFNKETQESIRNAAQGATVTVSTPIFISFHEMVRDALVARPDVTLVVDYRNAGKSYEMTIPAGSGDQLTTLFGDSQYAGFLYLGGAFATVEK